MLVFFGFAWRILGLDQQSLWRDEIDAIYFSLGDLPTTLSMFLAPGQNGVLYFLGLRPWLNQMGSSEFALRYPSVLFAVLAIPLIWQIGRRLLPIDNIPREKSGSLPDAPEQKRSKFAFLWQLLMRSPALFAALLFTINPYQLWYGQEGKMYTVITFLALLAVWFWLEGIGRGGVRPWLGFLIVVSLAIYTHLLMILIVPLMFAWFLIAWPQSKHHWLGFFVACMCLLLPYAPMVWWQWDLLTAPETLTALPFTPLTEIFRVILIYQSSSVGANMALFWLLPIFLLGLYGLLPASLVAANREEAFLLKLSIWRKLLLVFSWWVVPIVSIYLINLLQPVFLPRYIIWISPAAMMIIALGCFHLWQRPGVFAKGIATALGVYVIVLWLFVGWQQKRVDIKPDLRAAVRYVFEHRQPDELLILQIPHLEFAYRYYSSDQGPDPFWQGNERLGRWQAGPWTNNELGTVEAKKETDIEMRHKIAGNTDVWIILSEEEMWDSREFMIGWLTENGTLRNEISLHDVKVQYYHFE